MCIPAKEHERLEILGLIFKLCNRTIETVSAKELDQCETNENTQLSITTKGFSAVCSVQLILAIYLTQFLLFNNCF